MWAVKYVAVSSPTIVMTLRLLLEGLEGDPPWGAWEIVPRISFREEIVRS